MSKTTIEKIEIKIKNNSVLKENSKSELLGLVSELKNELGKLPEENKNDAESIANYANASTHEAIEKEDSKLLEHSLFGFKTAVEDFEVTHPQLTKVVNTISVMLSNIGV